MDDVPAYGGSFEEWFINLETVLHRCIEKLGTELEKIPFFGQPGNCSGTYYLQERN